MAPEGITKVEELLYTTKVEDVMARDVVVAHQSMSMADVKKLMQDQRITGVPVLEGDNMVGIVSMSDVIQALEKGTMHTPVRENMTSDVVTVTKDASVIEVAGKLGRHGFGRLPVVGPDGKLVGIVTTGTMIRSLLTQMDKSYQKREEERLETYRASHIFRDVLSQHTKVVLRYVVDDKDFTNAGKASSMIKKSLQRLGIKPPIVRRVAVAAYETEMNLVIHTDVGGEITVEISGDRILVTAVDHGPGIESIEKVMQPGFSTAPEWIRDMGFGAGMGLANIKRCSDVMRLMSQPGSSTRLDIFFLLRDSSSAAAGKKALTVEAG